MTGRSYGYSKGLNSNTDGKVVMLQENKKAFEGMFRFIDILIIFFSFQIAFFFRHHQVELNVFQLPLQFFIFITTYYIVWFYLSNRFQLYGSKRFSHFFGEFFDVGKTTLFCLVIASILAFFLREDPLSRLFMVYFWSIQTAFFILFRSCTGRIYLL